jgi:hypothetical protein
MFLAPNYLISVDSVRDGFLLCNIVLRAPPRTCSDMVALLRRHSPKARQTARLFEVLEVEPVLTFDQVMVHVLPRRKIEPESVYRFLMRAKGRLVEHGLAPYIDLEVSPARQTVRRTYLF